MATCLGIACEVSGLGEWELKNEDWYYVIPDGKGGYYADDQSLPVPVMDWLGFTDQNGGYGYAALTTDNDTKKHSFKRIAQTIRSNPEGLLQGSWLLTI